MSTMKKRIPMFLLALAMMVAMALPTFAASYRPKCTIWLSAEHQRFDRVRLPGACIEPDENRHDGNRSEFHHRNSQGLHWLLHDGYRECQLCRKSFR